MNPPFGAPTAVGKKSGPRELELAANDLAGAFILAAARRWAPEGRTGVLSSTALWFKPSVAEFRLEAFLGGSAALDVAAHFGGDILDGATVSASAVVVVPGKRKDDAVFFRLLRSTSKDRELARAIEDLREKGEGVYVHRASLDDIRAYRSCPLAYWISPGLRRRLSSLPALEGNGAEVRVGVQTSDDPRFVRGWWEVDRGEIGLREKWVPIAKSSEYSPLWDDLAWVVRWDDDGMQVRAFEGSKPQNFQLFGRPGVTYPGRSVLGFNPRAFPAACAFGNMGSVAFPTSGVAAGALLGFLASRPLEYVLSFSNGSLQGKKGVYPNHYEVGQIKDLPWPPFSGREKQRLEEIGCQLVALGMALQADAEESHQYLGRPGLAAASDVDAYLKAGRATKREKVERIAALRLELDDLVGNALGFQPDDFDEMNREFQECEQATEGPWSPSFAFASEGEMTVDARALISELVGIALGRFDVRIPLGLRSPSLPEDPFAPFPAHSPAMLATPVPDHRYSAPTDGVAVIDQGHPHDLATLARRVIALIWPTAFERVEQDLVRLAGIGSLEHYFRAGGARGFFDDHVRRYSKGRRAAPIYWRLATSSGRYGLVLYSLKLTTDLLHRLLDEYVSPKIQAEVRRLDEMRADLAAGQTRRVEVEEQEAFVAELKDFNDELGRAAGLWAPSLDDGVVVSTALLWRLFDHPGWRKNAQEAFTELNAGEHAWSETAMRVWPEHALRACLKDRSVAIAHGLADSLWVEEKGGKWATRADADAAARKLAATRARPAVAAALQSLLEAGASGPVRGRPRAPRGSRPRDEVPAAGGVTSASAADVEGSSVQQLLLDAIRSRPGGMSKTDVMAVVPLSDHQWSTAIQELLAGGHIERTGNKRAARYALARRMG